MTKRLTIHDRLPREKAICEYWRLCVDGKMDAVSQDNPFLTKSDAAENLSESEGKDNGSVVGCNLNYNNPKASARTLNGNNHAGNGNDNYAGSFALVRDSNINNGKGKQLTSQAASLNITDKRTATCASVRCDYGSQLPFWNCEEKAESNAGAIQKELIMEELVRANHKRKLKSLKRFFINATIISLGFDRTMERSNCRNDVKAWYMEHKQQVCAYIWYLLVMQTYDPLPSERRVIHKNGKGDKDRNADVFDVFDRIVQNVFLIVVETKFRNMLPRNVYSGVKERSLFSNNPKYCMVNKIRFWVKTHPQSRVGLTDIRHFYENTSMMVVFSVMFKTLVCPYGRWLLLTMFNKTRTLPIGGSLSQLMAMIVKAECDRLLLRNFNIALFCFGDNSLIGGEPKEVRRAMSFQMSFYEGRLCLQVKDDYQMRKVSDGFRFCKYDYRWSFVSPRAELRRRAIRSWRKGLQHYAGYKGILDKTDAHFLQCQIEHNMEITNRQGITVTTQRGKKMKHKDLPEDTVVIPVDYKLCPSEVSMKKKKAELVAKGMSEEEAERQVGVIYYAYVTYLAILPDAPQGSRPKLYHSSEGGQEIVEFYKLVEEGKQPLRQRLHIGHEGNKIFYKEFHITAADAVDALCEDAKLRELIYCN